MFLFLQLLKRIDQFGKTPSLYINNKPKYKTLTGGIITLIVQVYLFYSLVDRIILMINYEEDLVQTRESDITDQVISVNSSGYMPYFELRYKNEKVKDYGDVRR